MFGDISNDESDHWNPMSDNPVIPQTRQENVEEEDEHVDVWHDLLKKKMSMWMCGMIGHIERRRRSLLPLQIKKEKLVLS
jgi:hypothetical protein